jgi:hypothetical protein
MGPTQPRTDARAASPPRPGGGGRWLAAIASATALAVLAAAASPAADAKATQAGSETAGLADVLGSDLGAKAYGRGRKPPTYPSGAFIYRQGRYTPLDTLPSRPMTAHLGTNNSGQIVGAFTRDGATLRGFLRNQRGDYTSFDAAPDALGTLPFDINDRGTVVGVYADAQIEVHGFLRRVERRRHRGRRPRRAEHSRERRQRPRRGGRELRRRQGQTTRLPAPARAGDPDRSAGGQSS